MPVLSFTKRDGAFNSHIHKSDLIAYPGTPGLSDPLPIPPLPPGSRISAYCSPGSPTKDTLSIEYTISEDADVAAGSAVWFPWSSGDVSADTLETLLSPITGIRFNAATTATGPRTSEFVVII